MDRLGVRPPAVVAALVVLLPLLLATGAGATASDTPASTADRAFQRAKPTIVRIEMHTTATVSVRKPDVNEDALRQFVMDDARQRRATGRTFATLEEAQRGLEQDIVNEVAAHPATYVRLTADRLDEEENDDRAGSGVLVSSDGFVLTAGSLVPDDDTVRRTLTDKATARVLEEARSFPIDLVQTQGPAPTPEQFHKIVDAINSVMLPSMTVDDQQQKLLVEIGPARPGVNTGLGVHADGHVVVRHGPPERSIAVLKLPGPGLAGTGVTAAGRPSVVGGYPGTTPDGSDLAGGAAVEPLPISVTAVPAADGGIRLPAPVPTGSVGAPAFDRLGRVTGIVVRGSGGDVVVGAGEVRAALAQAGAPARVSPSEDRYGRAVDEYLQQHYRRTVSLLVPLERAHTTMPYVTDLVDRSRQAIAAGQDRTPTDSGTGWKVAATAALMVVAFALAMTARRLLRLRPALA